MDFLKKLEPLIKVVKKFCFNNQIVWLVLIKIVV